MRITRPRKMRLAAVVMAGTLLAGGCSRTAETPARAEFVNDSCVSVSEQDVLDVPSHRIESSLASWVLGRDDVPLNQVQHVAILQNGDVLVLSEFGRKLQVFDGTTGELVSNVGSSGQGPGEFSQALTLNLLSDGRIILPDRNNRRFASFGVSFEPGETTPFPAMPAIFTVRGLMDDGSTIAHLRPVEATPSTSSSGISLQHSPDNLVRIRPSGRVDTLQTQIRASASEGNVSTTVPIFRPVLFASVAGDRVAWLDVDGTTLNVLDAASDAVTCIAWRGSLPDAQQGVDEYWGWVGNMMQRGWIDHPRALLGLGLHERLEADGIPALELPRFAEVHLDVDGSKLVRMGAPMEARAGDVREYLQLSPSGVPLHRISANRPEDMTIHAIVENRVVASWRGPLGTEFVGLFQLSR